MFGKMINNFYYGKSGKGDFKKEDLPKNRRQLFFDMLRIRFGGLVKLNLMTAIFFLPMLLLIINTVFSFMSGLSMASDMGSTVEAAGIVKTEAMTTEEYNLLVTDALTADEKTPEQIDFYLHFNVYDFIKVLMMQLVLFLVPCIAITGPVQAGMAYVTRNWARDEHAFVWSDFKDAVKDNWKQALAASVITGFVPLIMYVCWTFYGSMSKTSSVFFVIPQVLVIVLGIIWMLGLTYLYPMMVSYKAKFRVIVKNSIIMSIARLPHTVLARLVMLLPSVIVALMFLYTGYGMVALMVLSGYYLLVGNGLARFVYASISNAAFDKFINIHMEGVQVDRGLNLEDDDEDDEEEENSTGSENPPEA